MNNWMKRRIERSRARCEKAATNNRTDKGQPAGAQAKPAGITPLELTVKGN